MNIYCSHMYNKICCDTKICIEYFPLLQRGLAAVSRTGELTAACRKLGLGLRAQGTQGQLRRPAPNP